LGYIAAGALFGVFDYVYLGFLRELPAERFFGTSPAGRDLQTVVMFGVLNLGIWLIPAIPAALVEVRRSGARWRAAVASLTVWSAGIVGYYLAHGARFALGAPGREELALAHMGAMHFWANWASVLRYDVLGGMIEYGLLAVAGGALVGLAASSVYLGGKAARGPETSAD
jgi:hypothetical protein